MACLVNTTCTYMYTLNIVYVPVTRLSIQRTFMYQKLSKQLTVIKTIGKYTSILKKLIMFTLWQEFPGNPKLTNPTREGYKIVCEYEDIRLHEIKKLRYDFRDASTTWGPHKEYEFWGMFVSLIQCFWVNWTKIAPAQWW